MPGYFFDLSGSRPGDEAFEAPSDALVVVFDSVKRLVEGVLTIDAIVDAAGSRATASGVFDAVLELLREGRAMSVHEPFKIEADRGAGPTVELRPFEGGLVVIEGGKIGVLPRRGDWDDSASPPELAGEALLAMGGLPGTPTTRPGSRWYRCPAGHRHFLPAGAARKPCPTPTCTELLMQDV